MCSYCLILCLCISKLKISMLVPTPDSFQGLNGLKIIYIYLSSERFQGVCKVLRDTVCDINLM